MCSAANGTPQCTASACGWTCANGFTHCGTGNTGCETDTRSDAAHCGGCNTACATKLLNVADPTCAASTCGFTTCALGFMDADNNKTNGCETACGDKGEACCPNRSCKTGFSCSVTGHCAVTGN
jgi:hypothetical protein